MRKTRDDGFTDSELFAWDLIIAAHSQQRIALYGHEADQKERVGVEEKRAICGQLMSLAFDNLPEHYTSKESWVVFKLVVEEVLSTWFDREGHEGYLVEKKHPLFAFHRDMHWVIEQWEEDQAFFEPPARRAGVAS